MLQITNTTNIALPLEVWLASDEYDHDPDPDTYSATQIIKPIRQQILKPRLSEQDVVYDVKDVIKSSIGTAIHDAILNAWLDSRRGALQGLNYDSSVIDNILVNPTKKQLKRNPKATVVNMEQRYSKDCKGKKITGKMDWIANGQVADFKTTSAYFYSNNTKLETFIQQLSIYRWLVPELITNNVAQIHYIFLDWKPYLVKQDNYPPSDIVTTDIPLMSLNATNALVKSKINALEINKDKEESELPRCTDEELWKTPYTYKYYANPNKLTKATKNFTSKQEAISFKALKGNKGLIKHSGGEVRACKFCPARMICTQKDEYLANGTLVL